MVIKFGTKIPTARELGSAKIKNQAKLKIRQRRCWQSKRHSERERESGKDQPFSVCRSVDRSILHTTPARLVLIQPVGKPLSHPPHACSRRTQVFQCHAFARAADMSLEAWCGVVLCSISFSVFSQLRVFDLDSNRPQRRQESGRMASSASSSSRAFASGFFTAPVPRETRIED